MPRRSRPTRRRTLVVAAALLVSSFAGLSPANAAPPADAPGASVAPVFHSELPPGLAKKAGEDGGDFSTQHWNWR